MQDFLIEYVSMVVDTRQVFKNLTLFVLKKEKKRYSTFDEDACEFSHLNVDL